MNVSIGSLVNAMASTARSIATWLIGAWILLTACGTLADVATAEASVSTLGNFAVSILQLALTVAVMRRGLDASGVERVDGGGIGGLFLLSIPLNIGVGLGLLLLVLPGLYLSARWRIAVPHMLTTGDGFDSIGVSWRRTEPHWRPLMIASLLPAVPMIGAVIVLVMAEEGAIPIGMTVLANAAMYAGILLGWLLDLTAYRLIAHPTGDLVETFA